jgi:hypothetical protein
VTKLGDVEMITANEIEGLFAVDLAFLQDFYGVINFGTQEEYEALIAAQREGNEYDAAPGDADDESAADAAADDSGAEEKDKPPVRTRVVEVPRDKD